MYNLETEFFQLHPNCFDKSFFVFYSFFTAHNRVVGFEKSAIRELRLVLSRTESRGYSGLKRNFFSRREAEKTRKQDRVQFRRAISRAAEKGRQHVIVM